MAKITLLSIFLVYFGLSSFGKGTDQGDDKLNQSNEKGKQGQWIYYGKDRPESGFPASGKIEEGKYTDDRKQGQWTKYYEDGKTKKLEGMYVDNRPNGEYTKYHANGKIKEVGNFSRNTQKGELKRYYPNGQLEYSANFTDDGKENGTVKYFHENGKLEYEYTTTAGQITGKATRYFDDGTIKEVAMHDGKGGDPKVTESNEPKVVEKVETTGKSAPSVGTSPDVKGAAWKPNGFNKVFKKGEIWQDGTFKNGVLWDGKEYVYDSDGILLKVKVYKEGGYHSDGQL
jgi:antitoxin component YwqK of YwqJK toxin-antitoxin module